MSKPPGGLVRCLTKNLREVALVAGSVDGSGGGGGLGEGEAFESGGEGVDVALKLAGPDGVAGPGERRLLGRGEHAGGRGLAGGVFGRGRGV